MKKINIQKGQSLRDIAIQHCGDVAAMLQISLDNGIGFDYLEVGTELVISDAAVLNGQIAAYLATKGIVVSSDIESVDKRGTAGEISADMVSRKEWLLTNGATVLIDDYPLLYLSILDTYGYSSSVDFRLPNFLFKKIWSGDVLDFNATTILYARLNRNVFFTKKFFDKFKEATLSKIDFANNTNKIKQSFDSFFNELSVAEINIQNNEIEGKFTLVNQSVTNLYANKNKINNLSLELGTAGIIDFSENLLSVAVIKATYIDNLKMNNNGFSSNLDLLNANCRILRLYSCGLTALKINKAAVETLFVYSNQLTSYDFSGMVLLKELRSYSNQIAGVLDLSSSTNLEYVNCSNNLHTSILLNSIKLNYLRISFNPLKLTSINSPKLNYIDVRNTNNTKTDNSTLMQSIISTTTEVGGSFLCTSYDNQSLKNQLTAAPFLWTVTGSYVP